MNTKINAASSQPKGSEVAEATQGGTAMVAVDVGEDAGQGLENVSNAERSIPFVRVLQSNAPEVKEGSGKTIAGARASMFMNIATGELFDGKKGLEFIPVHRDHNYPEWTPRNLGGGFVAIHADDDPLVLELRAKQGQFGKLWTGTKRDEQGLPLDGTELTETYYLYGMARAAGTQDAFFPCLVAFVSTQLKKYRNFMNRVTTIKYLDTKTQQPVMPAMFAHRWHLTSNFEKNKKGDYYGINISLFAKKEVDGAMVEDVPFKSFIPRSHPDYINAKEFFESVKAGKAKVDYAAAGETREPGEDLGAEDEVEM